MSRTVLVTGASSGIGRAVALELASRGDQLILLARRADALEAVAEACRERGASGAVVRPCDVTDRVGLQLALDTVMRLDAVVHAAAVAAYGRFTEIPEDVFGACVKVLSAWGWDDRPVGVVTVGSRRRPALVGSFGQRIASIGRLPFLGTVWLGESTHRANSAQRLAGLVQSGETPDLSGVDGPVLLVDDHIDTGWTMTVAAALLRDAGAPDVLPMALATVTG